MEAFHRGRSLPLGGRRQRALLAILLLRAGEVVTADHLIDELWGEHPPVNAAKMLHVYVSRLRKSLESGDPGASSRDVVVTRAGGYMLQVAPGSLDSERFLALADEGRRALADSDPDRAAATLDEALALWRGPAFVDLAYVSFAESEITRVEEARVAALEARIDADLVRGLHVGIVGQLGALLAKHPLRERLAAQLMLALYRSGRQADALEVYQRTRRTLVDELGLEPGERLRSLQEGILRQDASLQAPSVASEPARKASTPRTGFANRSRGVIGAAGLLGVAGIVALALFVLHGHSAGHGVLPNSVAVIDPRTDRVVASVPVGSRPAALSFGQGALWVANLDDDSVSRIDPVARRVVRTIATGAAPAGLAAGDGGVWVASPNGSLRLIDPAFNVVRTLTTGSRGYLPAVDLPSPAVVAADAVWVVNKTTVARIDPRTRRVVASTGVGLSPAGVAVGHGAVWVTDSSQDTVTRIDPQTNTSMTAPVGHGASATLSARAGCGSPTVQTTRSSASIRRPTL